MPINASNLREHETHFIFEGFVTSSHKLDFLKQSLTDFEQKVIDFARLWLSDKQDFEFMSSGSTGKPQKIKFTRAQIQASAQLTQETFELKAVEHALLCLDPDFIAGKLMIVRALEVGMSLICISPAANPLFDLKYDSRIDFAAFVPYQLEAILNNPSSTERLSKIKTVIVGGATVSTELVQKLQSLSAQFYETYGMTETLTHIAIRKLNPPEAAFHTLSGVRLMLDERLCLTIQANHLGPKVICTNDLVNILSVTSFSFIGRYDNLINTAGVKVSPEDVERKIAATMLNHLPESEYFIAGVKDKTFGERVVLFIEATALLDSKQQALTEQLQSHLKKWEVPKEVICVPHFKRTKSGKVKRRETILSTIAP